MKYVFIIFVSFLFFNKASFSQSNINCVDYEGLDIDIISCKRIRNVLSANTLPFIEGHFFPNHGGVQQIFYDGFDLNHLNHNKWNIKKGLKLGKGNEPDPEAGPRSENNVFVNNGNLVVKAKHESVPINEKVIDWIKENETLEDGFTNLREFKWSFGEVESFKSFKHGIIEARIKVPKTNGVWPAFWLFGGCGEIDIFEFTQNGTINDENLELPGIGSKRIFQSYHSWCHNMTCFNEQSNSFITTEDFVTSFTRNYCNFDYSNDFHIYKIEWDDYKITWFVDNIPYFTYYHYYFSYPLVPVEDYSQVSTYPYEYYKNIVKENPYYPKGPQVVIFGLAAKNLSGMKYPNLLNYENLNEEMLIDWISISEFKYCGQDIVYDSPSQFYSRSYQCNENAALVNFTIDNSPPPMYLYGRNITLDGNIYRHKANNYRPDFEECYNSISPFIDEMQLKAENRITFKSGFQVMRGAKLKAQIANCDEGYLRTKDINESTKHLTETNKVKSTDEIVVLKSNPNKDDKTLFDVSFYPNPFTEYLNIKITNSNSSEVIISLNDIAGKKIYEKFMNRPFEEEIDVSKLSPGLYIIKIQDKSNSKVFKVTKGS